LWSEHEATSLVYDREPDDTDFLTRYFKLMNDFYMVLPEEHKHYEDEIPGFYFYEQLLAPLREALSVAFKEELDCKLDGETPKATPIDILRWCTEKGIPIAPELQGCLEKTVGPTSRIHESDGRAHGNSTSLGTTLDKPKAKSHPIGKQTKLPSSRIVQQIENWSKVTIRVDEERVDGLWIRVTGNKQGVFVSAADLGFVDTRGRHIRVWNVLYDAIEAPKEGEDKKTHASIAYAYHPRIKKVTVRQYVDKINTILRAYFNIATDPFVSTVRGKSTLYSGEWLSLFEVRD
jgi:hypothetical protein